MKKKDPLKEKYTLRIKRSEIDFLTDYSGYVYVFFKNPFEISQPPVSFVNDALSVK